MSSSALSRLGRRTAEPPISWLMKMTLDHPRLISLAAGFTDNESLPRQATRLLLQSLLARKKTGQAALQYGTTRGDPVLRRLTAQHLQTLDTGSPRPAPHPTYDPDRLLITHGSQQLLYMVSEVLCDPGDIVLVEDPTYFVYLGIAQSHGLICHGIRMQEDGVDLDHLEKVLSQLQQKKLLPRLKLIYLVTYFQNPSGTTTSEAKKIAVLQLLRRFESAAGHPIYLLEDAAYRELRFQGEDVSSALRHRPERVLYTSTFSKPFATGVRVGFGLLPDPIHQRVLRVKANHDFGTANLLQQLLAQALASGAYQAQLARLRRRYAYKARIMAQAIQAHFPNSVAWRLPRGGLYIWARLPRAVRTGPQSQVFQTALRQNVLYVPGEYCYADDTTRRKPGCEMRLSFGGATLKDIPQGIERLGCVLHACLKS